MEYAVYVAIPTGENAGRIARAVLEAAPPDLDFSLREKGDTSESRDVELCFRIRGVTHPTKRCPTHCGSVHRGARRRG